MSRAHALTYPNDNTVSGGFDTDHEIRRIGEGLLDHSLPEEKWNHAAHCAAAIYFMVERPELDLPRRLPVIIRSYNVAKGVRNTEFSGYHETITQHYLKTIGQFLSVVGEDMGLNEIVNFFMRSPFSKLDYLLIFYSRELLFSVEARRQFVEPDIRPFPA